MDFELTDGQDQALDMVRGLMCEPPPVPAVLTGFAGTGKTTMLKAIASEWGFPTVLCPTGKAALRVHEATGMEAGTIHKWLYHPVENPKTGEIEFKRKESSQVSFPQNGLVIVDEASMVGRKLWEDLWDMCQILNLRILLVGDPFQLAPVEARKEDEEPFAPLTCIDTRFRVHLTEVTRQALDNPILRASMIVREQSRIDPALDLLERVLGRHFDDKCLEVYQQGGAVIVHRNDTRHRINAMIRTRLGYREHLVDGEPLLVLRNNYDLDRFNGEIVKFQGWSNYDGSPLAVRDNWKNVSLMLSYGLAQVDDRPAMLCPEQVRGEAQTMTESVIARYSKRYYADYYHDDEEPLYSEGDHPQYLGPPHLHANFGYALTCHKSQGSEWDTGMVLIENSTRPTTYEGRRWLYTALTRFKKQCFFSVER